MTEDIGYDYEKCHNCSQYINVNNTPHVTARVPTKREEKLFFHLDFCFRHYAEYHNVEVIETVRIR